jgi:hypothetical protein
LIEKNEDRGSTGLVHKQVCVAHAASLTTLLTWARSCARIHFNIHRCAAISYRSASILIIGNKWQCSGTDLPSEGLSLPDDASEEKLMLIRSIVLTMALAVGGSAFAQGVSDRTPGHKMHNATKSTAPGASEYAPGHKMQNATKSTAPGASEYAPGRQTTGSSRR